MYFSYISLGPLLTRFFIDVFGWRGCLRIISGIILQNVWLCIFHRPIENHEQSGSHDDVTMKNSKMIDSENHKLSSLDTAPMTRDTIYRESQLEQNSASTAPQSRIKDNFDCNTNKENGVTGTPEQLIQSTHDSQNSFKSYKNKFTSIIDFRLLLNPQFVIYGIATALFNFAGMCSMPQIVNKALADGIDKNKAAMIPSLFGLVNLILRPLMVLALARFPVNRFGMFSFGMVGTGIACICVGFASTFVMIMVFIGLVGAFGGKLNPNQARI